jgi:hypothetical protein
MAAVVSLNSTRGFEPVNDEWTEELSVVRSRGTPFADAGSQA